jgi:Circularly permutated YpsA SLOG family
VRSENPTSSAGCVSTPERPFQIISGGQTGVDRAALDAALSIGVCCGGWCPAGRRAEDGVIPLRYPLTELPGGGYDERTHRNVEDSDATLVVTFGRASGGTARTIEFCRQLGRPHLIVDAAIVPLEEAVRRAVQFVTAGAQRRLNVAGPRASGEPRAYAYAHALVRELCLQCAQSSTPGPSGAQASSS